MSVKRVFRTKLMCRRVLFELHKDSDLSCTSSWSCRTLHGLQRSHFHCGCHGDGGGDGATAGRPTSRQTSSSSKHLVISSLFFLLLSVQREQHYATLCNSEVAGLCPWHVAVKWTEDFKYTWTSPDSSDYVIIHLKLVENVPLQSMEIIGLFYMHFKCDMSFLSWMVWLLYNWCPFSTNMCGSSPLLHSQTIKSHLECCLWAAEDQCCQGDFFNLSYIN